jgi:hypothetical protein
VTNSVEDKFVDVIIEDGYLSSPETLLRSLREPTGRTRSENSRLVAEALSKLDDHEAVSLIRAVLDAATLSVVSLFDHGFKNSGLHACLSDGSATVDSRESPNFWHAYRSRVQPHGVLSQSRSLQ